MLATVCCRPCEVRRALAAELPEHHRSQGVPLLTDALTDVERRRDLARQVSQRH